MEKGRDPDNLSLCVMPIIIIPKKVGSWRIYVLA